MPDKTRITGNLVSDNNLFVNPTTDNTGIGTTNPTSKLHVVGNVLVTGIVTAPSFSGTATTATNVSGGIASVASLSVSGVSTLGTVRISSGIVTATSGVVTYYGDGSQLTNISASAIVGVSSYAVTSGTATTATNVIGGIGSITSLTVSGISTLGTVRISSGIITATSGVVTYYGDGSQLTNISATAIVGVSSYSTAAGIASYANVSGIATVAQGLTGTPNITVGIATASSIIGNLSGTATTATNVIGGIGSITSLTVSGITTLGIVTSGNIFSTGIVTASNFVGNLTGTATTANYALTAGYASTAGIATVAQGLTGTPNIVVGIATASSFIGNLTGTATTATSLSDAANIITGTISSARLSGTYNISITGSISSAGYANTAGIATVAQGLTGTPSISITNLNVSGVSTLGTVQVSSGIITATSGIITYYGDGSNLTGVVGTQVVTQSAVSSPVYPTLANAPGVSSIGISTTQLVFIPSTGSIGIGTTNPTSKLWVNGDGYFVGVVTANKFIGDGSSLTNITVSNAAYASTAGIATYATTAGIATYATTAGVATYASTAGVATYASTAGIATYATTAGVATALQNSRTFEITGDIIASPISFNGTGNVSLAATIQPNSVALGSDTTGDYIQSITGTSNQITVTGGTGESSTPVVSIASNPTLPGNVTIANDLQVNNNLNVTGNITIGGTTAFITVNDFRVKDADIITGFTTDSNGNDVSNDTTANHGGLSVASTEGNPLIQIYNPAIGEITPATYKKIMWFKAGSFAGLNTDAWLINYAVGIGSTQFPSGTRLAAGSVQFTENDLAVVRNINASGVITASSFVGNFFGNASYASSAGVATVAQGLTGTPNIIVGIATASSFVGNLTGTATTATNLADAANITTGTINSDRLSGNYNINVSYANTSGISTVAQGLTGNPSVSLANLNASGISTLGTVQISSGIVTATTGIITYYGDGSQLSGLIPNTVQNVNINSTYYPLLSPVISGSISSISISSNSIVFNPGLARLGIGSTSPTASLDIVGDTRVSGNLNVGTGGTVIATTSSGSVGIGTTNPTQELHVQGDIRVTAAYYDSTNSPGTSGQVLQSTVTGTQWTTASAAAGGSGKFDTSIDNVLYVQPTGTLDIVGVGTTTTQITTFPAGSNEYIIHSIHVTNVSNGDAEVTAGFVMNGKRVPASITVGGGPGIHTITVGSASSIVVGMAVTGTGNIGETVGVGSTAGLQYNTYVTSVDSNIITLSKPLSGTISGIAVFSPVSKIVSRLPVPVGSAVELLKQPFVLNASDSIVIQSTGAGSGIGSTSTAAISQTSGSNFLTVTAGAAITSFIAAGQLINGTGSNTGIQTNTYVGVGYTPGSLSIPMTRPATSTLASQILSFTETVVPQDGALQATIVYQSTTDLTYNSGVGLAGTVSTAIYGTGASNSATVQSIRVANVSDSGDYPIWVAIGNTDTIFSYLAYNMIIPKNSNIELCEAPKRLGIGQSIFAFSDTANVIEVQVAGKLKA